MQVLDSYIIKDSFLEWQMCFDWNIQYISLFIEVSRPKIEIKHEVLKYFWEWFSSWAIFDLHVCVLNLSTVLNKVLPCGLTNIFIIYTLIWFLSTMNQMWFLKYKHWKRNYTGKI